MSAAHSIASMLRPSHLALPSSSGSSDGPSHLPFSLKNDSFSSRYLLGLICASSPFPEQPPGKPSSRYTLLQKFSSFTPLLGIFSRCILERRRWLRTQRKEFPLLCLTTIFCALREFLRSHGGPQFLCYGTAQSLWACTQDTGLRHRCFIPLALRRG